KSFLEHELEARGVTRRDFVGFCAGIAVMLGLPRSAAAKIAAALETKQKPSVVWLEFQDCAGNTESFLRASKPTAADVILDLLSVDYHETIMAAAGKRAEEALASTLSTKKGQYIVVIEGSIPVAADGAYCTIGGRSALQIAEEACRDALAVIAVGSCAAYGGLPAAAPNPTGALSVGDAVPGIKTLINMPACPVNGENLVALISHFLTFGHWPATDHLGRPLFAYGKSIHDACERRAHFDAGQYVEMWGDAAHRDGQCLYKMGCKGPVTFQNCPNIGWNDNTNWPIGCGHPCIGCAEPQFWDRMTPFYRHLAGIPGFADATSIDKVGAVAVAAVGAAFTGHALVQIGKSKLDKRRAAHAPAAEPREPTPETKGDS
ncbi:MAG TPA: hydrogenase small subunit, partial [Kofleriaceae bacterium]|nr:hydrogenase small subunit [Kofleriaceae bacterium]